MEDSRIINRKRERQSRDVVSITDVARSSIRGYTPGAGTRCFSLFADQNPRASPIYRVSDFSGASGISDHCLCMLRYT